MLANENKKQPIEFPCGRIFCSGLSFYLMLAEQMITTIFCINF